MKSDELVSMLRDQELPKAVPIPACFERDVNVLFAACSSEVERAEIEQLAKNFAKRLAVSLLEGLRSGQTTIPSMVASCIVGYGTLFGGNLEQLGTSEAEINRLMIESHRARLENVLLNMSALAFQIRNGMVSLDAVAAIREFEEQRSKFVGGRLWSFTASMPRYTPKDLMEGKLRDFAESARKLVYACEFDEETKKDKLEQIQSLSLD